MLNKLFNHTIATFSIFALFVLAAINVSAAPPTNDNFADAQILSGIQAHTLASNSEATIEAGEPLDQFNTIGKSVWYRYTAPQTRFYSIRTTRDTNFDTHLSLFTGTQVNALTFVNSNNNVLLPNRTSVIIHFMNAGDTVNIRVAGEINDIAPSEGVFRLDITPLPVRQSSDYDRDGKTDFSVFRPSTGVWYKSLSSSDNAAVAYDYWGKQGDVPVPGDWDGNFRTDAAVFRPSEGNWYIKPNGGIPAYSFHFGLPGDIPVPGSYSFEGDFMAAVFRPSNGVWYFCNTNDFSIAYTVHFGLEGDIPVPGDYDLDGKTDVAVYRPSTGVWYIWSSTDGVKIAQFGLPGDKPVAADYDGDGRYDIAVYRPSNGMWYVLRTSDNEIQTAAFGLPEDVPTVGDYTGDGKADYAVFRPSTGVWYVAKPEGVPAQNFNSFNFGLNGDIPVTRFGLQP